MKLEDQFDCTNRNLRGTMLIREVKSKPHQIRRVLPVHGDETLHIVGKEKAKQVKTKTLTLLDRYANGSFVFDEDSFGEIEDVYLN